MPHTIMILSLLLLGTLSIVSAAAFINKEAVAAPTTKSPDSSSEEVEHNQKHGPAARAAIEAADSSSGDVDERRRSHRHEAKRASEVAKDSGERAAAAWLALSDENGLAAGMMRPRTRKYARGMPGVFPAGILG